MNLKKMLIVAGLVGMIANTTMAAQGDTSIIPKIRLGTGEAESGSIFGENLGDEDINIYGAEFDLLYSYTDNFEAGVGFGVDKIEFDDSDIDELDFITFNFYGVGRYNFDVMNGCTPYISGKFGYKWGDEDYSETIEGITITAEIEGGPFIGIAAGIEYNDLNIEIGYERIDSELDVSGTDGTLSISDSTDVDIDAFYLAVGYRFDI